MNWHTNELTDWFLNDEGLYILSEGMTASELEALGHEYRDMYPDVDLNLVDWYQVDECINSD